MECCICYSVYNSQREPYIGPCGHSFCLHCWQSNNNLNILRCHLCKKMTLEDSIIKNFLAIELMERNDSNDVKSLIEVYEEHNQKFLKKLQESKILNEEVNNLRETRRRLIDSYHEESQEIIKKANIRSIKIVDNAKDLSNLIIDQTKEVIGNVSDIYQNISLKKEELENCIHDLEKKIKEFRTI